jgi:hypothetical protein
MTEALLNILYGYAVLGLAFAVPFTIAGLQRLDSNANGATPGFRLLIVPGAAALWPLLAVRLVRRAGPRSGEPPAEINAHRAAARLGGAS